MYLNLIVPSTKLEIFASNSETGLSDRVSDTGDVQSKEIGPFVEEELLNLTCVSAGGNPPPRVEWWANEQLIDDSYERTIVSQVNRVVNLLKVGPLDRSYQGRAYTCKVTNSDLSSPVEQTVSLKVDCKYLFGTKNICLTRLWSSRFWLVLQTNGHSQIATQQSRAERVRRMAQWSKRFWLFSPVLRIPKLGSCLEFRS